MKALLETIEGIEQTRFYPRDSPACPSPPRRPCAPGPSAPPAAKRSPEAAYAARAIGRTSRSITADRSRLASSRSKSNWSPSQNFSEVPKYLARRSAVSGVRDLFPRTISFIRRGGTLISRASLFWLMPRGFRNSSSRTSPGWTFDGVSGMTSPLSSSPRSRAQRTLSLSSSRSAAATASFRVENPAANPPVAEDTGSRSFRRCSVGIGESRRSRTASFRNFVRLMPSVAARALACR